MRFSKHRDYPTPVRYGFTRQCLALNGGRCAVALNHDRQLWRVSLAEPEGRVEDLCGLSATYQQWRQTGDTFEDRTYGGGALFAYRQGFGVVFVDQVLLFETADQPLPLALEILNPDGRPQPLPLRFTGRSGCPGAACWLPADDSLAVAYEHGQFRGRRLFLAQLQLQPAPAAPAAYQLAAPPRPLTLGPQLQALQSLPAFAGVLDAPQLLALRQEAGQLQVATFGGYYSARFGGAEQGLGLLAVEPLTATATALVQQVPTRWPTVVLPADGRLAAWNQFSPAAKGGLYFYDFVAQETTRLGFQQKVFTTGLFHDKGEMLKWLSFDRAGNLIWVFSSYGCSVFEAQGAAPMC